MGDRLLPTDRLKMTNIETPNLFSTEESENEFGIEILPNGENVLAADSSEVHEVKIDSWRQASLKLSTIFPNLDPEFIKKTYIQKSSDENLREEDILEAVKEEVLKNGEKHTHFEILLGNPHSEPKLKTDECFQYLSSVFPDANPLYLKTIASKNDEPDVLEKFVEEKLETRDYPTKENYVPVKNKKGVQADYVDSFNVEEFLKYVPDPIQVYENRERKCAYDVSMFELLKNHFNKLTIPTISEKYTLASFNPLLTFEALQVLKCEMKIKRKKKSVKTDNKEVLHEFSYITNKERIKNYIKQQKENEEKLLQKMKDKKEFLQCECCFDDLPPLSKYTITCQEGHVFCDSCLIRGTEVELAHGRIRISCFAECTSEFNLVSLQKVLKPNIFKILLGKIQEEQIKAANIEGLVSCPFCHFALILPEDENVFRCMNPDCGQESCRLCKKLNHLPKECEILEKSKKARIILEEMMTAALVRKCGQCGKEFIKSEGCNVVICSCGATICYFCGQLSISHEHLNGRCGAQTDSITDAEGVIYVAKKIEEELLRMDPNLKINADSILPTVAGSSRLNQYNFENAQVSAHALRAANTLPKL